MFARFFCSIAFIFALVVPAVQSARAEENTTVPVYDTLTSVKDWLNTSRPLTPEDLQGRVVLVDFWTYCCINCMHVIPKLQELEKEFGNKLTVVGVHSAKFANESETDNIRQAIQKYGIHHPVVNDEDFIIWNAFGINAWPTLLLIGPDGLLKEVYRGEGDIDAIRKDIKNLINKTGDKLVTAALPITLEADKIPPTVLRFPTKLASIDDHLLVISDSGHQRILIVDLATHKIIQTIGSGEQGFKDGGFDKAQFNNPQGVLAEGDLIYVADTGNHRLRLIDLNDRSVSTLAGTGERGDPLAPIGSRDAKHTALASPWDLAFFPDQSRIVIANAGSHQLWSFNRRSGQLSLLAGDGHEDIVDGALSFNSLAQTSGLSPVGDKLYFVDAETSSLRIYKGGTVDTLIGSGLFDFGLKDGDKDKALMQHPLGLSAQEDRIYVADTYNHKIRLYKDGNLTTLPLDGLKEPNAILKIGDLFYVADTNNHRIVMMNDKGRNKGVLEIMPMEKPVKYSEKLPNPIYADAHDVGTDPAVIFDLPKKWHINPDAPSYVAVFDEDKNVVAQFSADDLKEQTVKLTGLLPDHQYTLQGIIYYCATKAGSQCLIRGVQADLHIDGKASGDTDVHFDLPAGQ